MTNIILKVLAVTVGLMICFAVADCSCGEGGNPYQVLVTGKRHIPAHTEVHVDNHGKVSTQHIPDKYRLALSDGTVMDVSWTTFEEYEREEPLVVQKHIGRWTGLAWTTKILGRPNPPLE